MRRGSIRRLLATVFLICLVMPPAGAAVLQAIYDDPAGFGFNDSTPAAPAPGNPAATLGGQRRAVLEAALDIWAARIDSEVAIRVEASFEDLGCGDDGFLGQGSPTALIRNFPNTPRMHTNYPAALAVALAGSRLGALEAELRVQFNFRVETEECFSGVEGYWYGLDQETAPELGTVSFLALALHELAHGLGFSSLTNQQTRQFLGDPPRPDILSEFLFSLSLERNWREMSANERVMTSTSEPDLVWIGEQTNLRAAERLLPPATVRVNPPVDGQDIFPALVQGFPPYPPLSGLTAPLVIADDGSGVTTACQPLANADEAADSIVLATRGGCLFVTKWQHAHDAGAAGLLLADNVAENHESAITRDHFIFVDVNLPLPYWTVTRDTGQKLMAAVPGTVITFGYDLAQAARGVNEDFVTIQASPDTPGSNVTHFSEALFPTSLMDLSISNQSFTGDLDIVPDLFADIGWPDGSGKLVQFTGNWFNPDRDGEGCQLTFEDDAGTSVLTCYLYRDGEQFWLIGVGVYNGDRIDFDEMIITSGANYGSAFRAEDVERILWGRIRMRLIDCNNAWFDLFPELEGLGRFHVVMTRIVQIDCQISSGRQPDRRLSGNYFVPERDGEGIQLAREILANIHVLTLYTYLEGRQVWAIGSGDKVGNRIVFDDTVLTRGAQYGREFRTEDVEVIPFGTITLDVIDCNNVRVAIEPILPEFEPSDRVLTRIVQRVC